MRLWLFSIGLLVFRDSRAIHAFLQRIVQRAGTGRDVLHKLRYLPQLTTRLAKLTRGWFWTGSLEYPRPLPEILY
jgi:hypothetical protein